MKAVNNDPDIQKLLYYKAVAELGRMIVATFPHEDFGRYPTEITTDKGKENSNELYKQHKDGLWKLIDTVANALHM